MQPIFTGTQVRGAEAPWLEAGHGPALMRQAAWGLAHRTRQLLQQRGPVYGSRAVGLIGKGNNGGDTLWALSFLADRGVSIAAVAINVTADQFHPEGLAAFQRAGGRLVSKIDAATDVVVDGVFGTGFHASFDLPGFLTDHDLAIPQTAAIIACDVPSGLMADTGDIPGNALRADVTVTFGAPKLGLFVGEGGQHSGDVFVVDIGLGAELAAVQDPWWMADEPDVRAGFGPPRWDAHKYSRGVLSVVAGSPQYPGAAVLVVNAVAATGVGYISLVAQRPRDNSVADQVLAAHPQVVIEAQVAQKATAVVIGPGFGNTADERDDFTAALQVAQRQQLPVLVDASGLDLLDEDMLAQTVAAMVLTPHIGEMQRLTKRLAPDLQEQHPVAQAAAFAQRFGVWIVLKSADTYVLSPGTLRSVHPAKTSELATAGTGDTLAGILGAGIASLDATDDDFHQQLFTVLASGVRLHSLAGELAAADGGIVVSSLQDDIREAKRQAMASS